MGVSRSRSGEEGLSKLPALGFAGLAAIGAVRLCTVTLSAFIYFFIVKWNEAMEPRLGLPRWLSGK